MINFVSLKLFDDPNFALDFTNQIVSILSSNAKLLQIDTEVSLYVRMQLLLND